MPGHVNLFEGQKDGTFKPSRILPEQKIPKKKDPKEIGVTRTMATMNLVDWDGDGDLDMLFGAVDGLVSININEGDRKIAKFGYRRLVRLVDGSPVRTWSKSDPIGVDWDRDGILDLLIGDCSGDVIFFRGTKDRTFQRGVSIFTGRRFSANLTHDEIKKDWPKTIPNLGVLFRLDVTDWNGDGKPDLLIGASVEDEKDPLDLHGYVYLLIAE